MKFLDLLALNEVNLALTFDTESYTILGNCDAYSTKPARDHKELYARVEKTLEDKYKKMVNDLNTLPAQVYQHIAPKMNLERHTPFGTFHERANRRVFAFMIAALNEFHYDYDFANTLNPDHFVRESLEDFKYNIDDTMRHLRPQLYSAGLPAGAMTPLGTPIWSDRSWELIDSEMSLQDCAIYKWKPPVDPFDGEDGSMWSFRYLLYSKEHKRVCYLHLRCVPRTLSYSPTYPESLMDRYKHRVSRESNEDQGSSKRAEYWLGDRAKYGVQFGSSGNLDDRVIDHPYEEVVDREEVVNWLDVENQQGLHEYEYMSDEIDSDVESLRDRDMSRERERSAARQRERSVVQERETRKRSIVRSMSEDVADRMELMT